MRHGFFSFIHKYPSEAHREAKTTMLIRFRCYFKEVGLLSGKVMGPCSCPVIREAPVVLGLLPIKVSLTGLGNKEGLGAGQGGVFLGDGWPLSAAYTPSDNRPSESVLL